jgi:amidohydrolase
MSDLFEPHINDVLPGVAEFRRELHAYPELAFKEHETAARIRAKLAQLPALKVLPPYIETDVVAVLNEDRPGPCIALRADIDALPIEEETGVPYRSTRPGLMHACGHDGHAATLLGAAAVLCRVADQLPGKVKFVFQPAEEDGGGGGVLCERGVLESPKVDAAIALHAWPFEPVGHIAIRSGWVMAASNPFHITVHGQGCHGAYPHRGIDPIAVSAHIITALQTIVSRTVDPQDPAVVTIGCINAGAVENVIPAKATMLGTMRYTRAELGREMRERLARIVEHTALAHGATAELEIQEGYPPMYNDEKLTDLVVQTGRDLLGESAVVTKLPVSMGVEDFAYYARKVPAAMFRLGVRPPGADTYPSLHNPQFNFNDDALAVGIRVFCETTRRFLDGR